MTSKFCSICRDEFEEYGNNPYPFGKVEERCCNRCNNYFVVPTRIMNLRGTEILEFLRGAAQWNHNLLKVLANCVEIGDMLVKANELAREHLKPRLVEKDETE